MARPMWHVPFHLRIHMRTIFSNPTMSYRKLISQYVLEPRPLICCNLLAPVTLSLTTELPMDADRMENPRTMQRATPHWRMLSRL